MDHLVGQTLNRYQILNLLGEGGMGAVYRAHDTTLQRDVAIKVMHSNFARQPNFQERFLQEARTAARLDHPGIVQIYDFGSFRSQLYIVMKFIPGDNLEDMLRELHGQDRWLPLGEAVQLISQVALALDYAHRQGVLHRDIKPGNIMLESEVSNGLPYRPVVTDLGLAKLIQGSTMTQEGTSMGTPAYMSPEQAQGKTTDARSDVYSLGVLLYELATGRLPFNPRTITEAIQAHVHTPPPPPRRVRPDLPEAIESIILKAIEKDPPRRYQNALALSEALKAASPAAARVVSAPAGIGATISLLTQYQNSMVDVRGPSVLQEFDPANLGASQDRIQVLADDQTTHEIQFKYPSMIVGRDPEADIHLDDPKVSRNHARIETDGGVFRVTDLGSTNGTFISNHRLMANLPQVWHPGQSLRIGGAHLRLLPAGGTAGAEATLPNMAPVATVPAVGGTTRVASSQAPTYAFTSLLEPVALRVGAVGRVIVRNMGTAADRFTINWFSPGDSLSFNPPALEIDIPAGQEVVAEFQVESNQGNWIGKTRALPFSVQISPSAGTPQMHHGETTVRAAVPGWAIPVLLVLCLAVAGGLILLSNLLFGGGGSLIGGLSTTDPAIEQTQIAIAVEATRRAVSQTALALQNANQATLQSATQTGQALAMEQATASAFTAAAQTTAQAGTAAVEGATAQAGVQTSAAGTAAVQEATLQAGLTQTAAVALAAQQLAGTQTAQAYQLTAASGAAQTANAQTAVAAQLTGNALSAQLTATAHSATLTAAVGKRIAYVYHSDSATAADYKSFLESQDYTVDLVSIIDVYVANFGAYDLVLIGPETGNPGTWETNAWGANDSMATAIAGSGTDVLGLGHGGSLFLQALGMAIGWGGSMVGDANDVKVVNPAEDYWHTPNDVSIPGNKVVKLYDNNSSFVAFYMPDPVMAVFPIASLSSDPNYYPLLGNGEQFWLWGFNNGPGDMSNKGQHIFLNLVYSLTR